MKRKYFFRQLIFLGLFVAGFAGCKTEYDPPLKPLQSNLLVVEGFIDGAAPTIITLSRTRMITTGDTASVKHELGARVTVEDDKQNRFLLQEMGEGVYSSLDILNLNPTNKYCIRINTRDGKEYISDFVSYKQSPPIDSVGWYLKNDGVQMYANTHDDTKQSRYYRWTYVETWEFHSLFDTDFEYFFDINKVLPITDRIYRCWNTKAATNILIGSSTKLTDDVIFQEPLAFIEPHSKKMSVLYSILVTQYSMDINAFNYWEAMKNNTEKVGSIFDPQPNQTVGNIHSVATPSERVVGYIGAGASVQKRVYVNNRDLPDKWNTYETCDIIEVSSNSDSTKMYFGTQGFVPISEGLDPAGRVFYTAALQHCVDCRLLGTNVKPDFWP